MTLKKILFGMVAVITWPLFILVFVGDRLVLSFLVWNDSNRIEKWIANEKEISYSFIRVFVVALIVSLIYIWK